MIQAVPISCTNQEDILIWRGTKNGVFSVKSAYYLQKEVESFSMAGNSSRGDVTKFGRGSGICRFQVRVEKKFLWHACNEILPTRENLCRRKIIMDPLCPLCGIKVEFGFHILWHGSVPLLWMCGVWTT
jgi:hypothetical protein